MTMGTSPIQVSWNYPRSTVYRDHPYGELFDLQEDPNEQMNRWDDPAYAGIKCQVMAKSLNAELHREPPGAPRISHA